MVGRAKGCLIVMVVMMLMVDEGWQYRARGHSNMAILCCDDVMAYGDGDGVRCYDGRSPQQTFAPGIFLYIQSIFL